jgi:hypothetical protein
LEDFKHKEQVFKMKYVYVGTSDFNKLVSNDPMWEYIRNNYRIELVGVMRIQGQLAPVHFILRKGGKFNLTEIQTIEPLLAKNYDSKQGDVPYYYIQTLP